MVGSSGSIPEAWGSVIDASMITTVNQNGDKKYWVVFRTDIASFAPLAGRRIAKTSIGVFVDREAKTHALRLRHILEDGTDVMMVAFLPNDLEINGVSQASIACRGLVSEGRAMFTTADAGVPDTFIDSDHGVIHDSWFSSAYEDVLGSVAKAYDLSAESETDFTLANFLSQPD